MKDIPKAGTEGEVKFVVEAAHVIDYSDEQMPAVLSTASLVWHLEHAARAAILPYLENGESTVGTRIELSHVAPTPIGETVRCLARVIRVKGSEVFLALNARDEHGVIAHGTHILHVVQVNRFSKRAHRNKK